MWIDVTNANYLHSTMVSVDLSMVFNQAVNIKPIFSYIEPNELNIFNTVSYIHWTCVWGTLHSFVNNGRKALKQSQMIRCMYLCYSLNLIIIFPWINSIDSWTISISYDNLCPISFHSNILYVCTLFDVENIITNKALEYFTIFAYEITHSELFKMIMMI